MNQDFKEQINKESQRVFPCNLINLNLVIESYQEEMINRPFETDNLKAELFEIIKKYQQKDCSKVPPHLCRQLKESGEDFLNRLYEIHGCKFIKTKGEISV